jgi:DNA recombination protein RmuC
MSAYCDFAEQETTSGEQGAIRPDLTVRLPNDRIVVVDSKVPLAAYLEACEASDESARNAALANHAQQVRAHMTALMGKAYWSQLDGTPDFVVCFIPGESFFAAAIEQDRTLLERGFRSGVVLASPATLFALLKAVEMGWREHQLAENAARIAEAGRELHARLCKFAEHLAKIGKGLTQASQAYDDMVGSYDRMLLPSARRLAELGASSGKDLPEVPTVEGPARSLPEGGTAEE